MRIKLNLELVNPMDNLLPINYQYAVSSWIYNTLRKGNGEFATWLHEQGYRKDHKIYRLFHFSNLWIREKKIIDDRIQILSPRIGLVVSFLPMEIPTHFIRGLFQDTRFRIGDKKSQVPLVVKNIQSLEEPEFQETMHYRCSSPIVVSTYNPKVSKHPQYLSPEDEGYQKILMQNITRKYDALCDALGRKSEDLDVKFSWKMESAAKGKLVTLKGGTPMATKVRGYQYQFLLTAPIALQRTAYYGGFGEKNAQGFGCCEVVRK
jgi:CRISPR-associated endoribonuclease Cas6